MAVVKKETPAEAELAGVFLGPGDRQKLLARFGRSGREAHFVRPPLAAFVDGADAVAAFAQDVHQHVDGGVVGDVLLADFDHRAAAQGVALDGGDEFFSDQGDAFVQITRFGVRRRCPGA